MDRQQIIERIVDGSRRGKQRRENWRREAEA